MSTRKGIKKDDITTLLTKCRRRCCLCYYLEDDKTRKQRGQVAHIDRDPSNNELKNLVYLCLDHHAEYDSKSKQSKGLTEGEVILYKEKLESLYDDEPPTSSEVEVAIKQTGVPHEITRAEVLQTAIVAIDGLAGYEAPRTPTFDDVSVYPWYFDYVESAVQLGIISGYTDTDGNLTGLFGPEDIATRAWTTKVLVNSFSISRTIPTSPFTDVTPSHPYYGYILMAYNQSIIDGFENDTFRPDEPLTRALMAKWVVNAQNPVLRG